MTNPTINTAAVQGLARVVDTLDDQVQQTVHIGPPELNEVIQLAERMRIHAGDEATPVLDRIWAASEAIDAASAQIITGTIETSDMLDVEPDTIGARVLDACRDRAARETLAYQSAWQFRDALAGLACTALKDSADATVMALRSDFDGHAKVIASAVKVGISEQTDTTELLTIGSQEQIAAFRALPAAVAGLDQIAALRNDMTRMLRYGPAIHPVHSFISGVTKQLDAEGLENRYEDRTEIVQYNQDFGSMLTKVRLNRLGGRWLALATHAGITLRLNTADEVTDTRERLSR